MLDVDLQMKSFVLEFVGKYAKAHNLGGYVILETSKSTQTDLFGNQLGNFAVIFGKHLTWGEIQWHIDECLRLGIINREFAVIRKFGSITIRVNAKNDKIPAPNVVYSKYTKKDKAVKRFLDYYEMCKDLQLESNLDRGGCK